MRREILAAVFLALSHAGDAMSAPAEEGAKERDLPRLQQEFLSWKFGMFIHFNMATFAGVEWATGQEDPLIFNPTRLDCGQWADAAKAAGMEYAILTVKHTGGWCLWNSKYTDHDIARFKNFRNGKGDIVREFCDAFRKRGIKVGFYYCFPVFDDDWKNYWTLPIKGYRDGTADAYGFIKNQFTELLTQYGNVAVMWVDQAGSLHGGLKQGDWLKLKRDIHALQPNCVVIANNASNFQSSDIFGYEYPWSKKLPPKNNRNPSEVCENIQQGWFSKPEGSPPRLSADFIVNQRLLPLNANNSNYLLNCGPDARGLMPDSVVERLDEVGRLWKKAGEQKRSPAD